jgi:hypothetical protein
MEDVSKLRTWFIRWVDSCLRFGPECAVLVCGEVCFPVAEDFAFDFERRRTLSCADSECVV